ncbi:MAG: UPF0182 family protein [Clostridia bacterium]|nr:UPF0182 family protein [Clostridia bacterium]
MEKSKNSKKTSQKVKNKTNTNNRSIVVIIVSIIVCAIVYIIVRGNYLEMKEIGEEYIPVFWQNTIYIGITFIANYLFLFLSFYLTNKTIKKGLQVFFDDEKKEMPKFPNKSISFIVALIGSAVSTKVLLNKIILGLSSSKFGINDPVFNLDISFMVLKKPMIQFLLVYLLIVVVATLAYSILFSIIVLNKTFDGVSRESITKVNLVEKIGSRVKLIAVLVALIIVFFMATNIGNEKFMGIELSDGTSYSMYGAGKADATVKLVGYFVLAFLAMYSILDAYKNLKNKNVRRVVGDVLVVPVYLIALAIVLALYQLIFIGTETLASNERYIQSNIEYTKQAYGLNQSYQTINYSGTIEESEINNNNDILSNIDIVTKSNVLQDFQTSNTSKGYYNYRKTQIEEYNINGVKSLVYITPREISNTNTTYYNKTFQYTHGYGSIVTLAGRTDENGYLDIIENELGNLSDAPIPIKQPRIYYGLETNNTAVINNGQNEIDYVYEDTNKEENNRYDGSAGLKLGFVDRLILGIKEGDFQLAFSKSINSQSKILANRNVIERAKLLMPYLKYDNNPYMVIDDSGNQYWVIDAYTTSNYYPFSQKTNLTDLQEINYIRNSAKVIINAYDGTTKLYIIDRNDPIIMAYNGIYPELFAKADDEIPEDISKHFVYPETLYNLQSKMVEEYHDIKPEVLYRGNDIWEITRLSSNKTDTIKPYYTMVKNSKGEASLGLVIPYTAYGKQNLVAYMIGTVEDGKYVLRTFMFSSESNVLGPIQIQTQIDQDENIAAEIASLNTTGTRITKKLIAVPVNDTILYVETIYQQLINETTQKPNLKRVVVASGNKIAIGTNISEALKNLLSQYAVDIEVGNTDNMQDLAKLIIRANENLKNSSKSLDWKLYGEDMQVLTGLIDQLQKVVEEQERIEKEQNLLDENMIDTNETVNDVKVNETN